MVKLIMGLKGSGKTKRLVELVREAVAMENGDECAKKLLTEHNLRLVVYISRRFENTGVNLEDLISIGTIGLIKAINTFRSDKNIKLATYASRCIENEILMHLRSEKKKSREVSLYEPIGTDKEGNSIHLMDVIEADSCDFIAEFDRNNELQWLFRNINTILTPDEFNLIKKRYGILGEKELTQREVAQELGISRSYVSRIEKKCLQKLKTALYPD